MQAPALKVSKSVHLAGNKQQQSHKQQQESNEQSQINYFMAWQPPETAITTAKSTHFIIKSLSNQCQITNKVTFFQITTLKYSIIKNNNSVMEKMASEIADRHFDNNFIGVPQKFRYITRDFL